MRTWGVHWRYKQYGGRLHAIQNPFWDMALCGQEVEDPKQWFGTGSQDEIERARNLRRCSRCITAATNFKIVL